MFISPAYAQFGGGGDGSSALMQMAPLVLIFVVFYFFLIRPQQQKAKSTRAMLEAIRRGDRVVTGGGIIGTVSKVLTNDEVQVEIADGVRVRVLRGTISSVLARTEPVKEKSEAKGEGKPEEAANDAAAGEPAAAEKPPLPAWRRFLGI